MRKTVFFVLALVMVVCASAALAQQGPPPGGPPMGPGQGRMGMGMMGSCPAMGIAPPPAMMIERTGDTLALTDDQKTKLTATLTKSETALAPLRQKSADATKALRDAVMAPTFDAAKVAELLAAAQKADAAIAASEIQTWSEIRAILTADQISKLAQSMNRRGGGNRGGGTGGGGRRGNQPGGPPPGPASEPPPAPGQ